MRSLLLPITTEDSDRNTVSTGFGLARKLGAHPTFLLARPQVNVIPVYAHSVTAAGYTAMMHSLNANADLREMSVKQMLMVAAAERGLKLAMPDKASEDAQATFQVDIGDDDEVMRRFAAVNDLVVFARGSRPGESLETSPLLKTALEYSGRPILVVTDDLPNDLGTVTAIAWSGSTEGARAVTAALPILCRSDDVVILTVSTGKTRAEEGERLQKYLSRHGVRARTEQLDQEDHVGQELIAAASRCEANLLVSGGYTHSRMRQTLFGGVTHHLLENCTLPLLMAH